MEQFVGERPEPAKRRGILSAPAHCRQRPFDQIRRSLESFSGQRVADRIGFRTVLLEPLARSLMQNRYLIGMLRHQMRREYFGKEVVIAIPVASVIQRHHKEIASLQGFQARAAPWIAGHCIAQRAIEAVENGRLEQKAANRLRLTLQDLFDQIVHDVPVVSGEGTDEPRHILMALQGQRS